MAKTTTFVKIDRNITRWQWWADSNTVKIWLYLLLKANVTQYTFQKFKIKRGQLVTSIPSLASKNNLTVQQVKTILSRLEKTGEISRRNIGNKFSIITIKQYEKYQDKAGQVTTAQNAKTATSEGVIPERYRDNFETYQEYKEWSEQ